MIYWILHGGQIFVLFEFLGRSTSNFSRDKSEEKGVQKTLQKKNEIKSPEKKYY